MGTSAPEVKRLTLSQRLNGKKWPPELPPLSGFLLFFVTCHAMQCHTVSRNMHIFNPGGDFNEQGK